MLPNGSNMHRFRGSGGHSGLELSSSGLSLHSRQPYLLTLNRLCISAEHWLSTAEVDFCVTLGGDGTVLHLASLFRDDEPLPPLVSFAMGTLGFLTPFDAGDFEACLESVLNATEQPVFCTLRTRKRCELMRWFA